MGTCDTCKTDAGPFVTWPYSTPVWERDTYVNKYHRLCVRCGLRDGYLTHDEVKRIKTKWERWARINQQLQNWP